MTLLELIAAVSNTVAGGETLSASTYPTKTEVVEWLNEAQSLIAVILPIDKIHEITAAASFIYTSAPYLTDFASDIIDVSSIDIDWGSTGQRYQAMIIKAKEYYAVRKHSFLGTTESPVVSIIGGRVQYYPINPGTMYMTYKKKPADLSGDSDISEVGLRFDTALHLYAVAMFYKAAEQIDLYAKYYNDFLQILVRGA